MTKLQVRFGHVLSASVLGPLLLTGLLAGVAVSVSEPSVQLAVVMLLAVVSGVALRGVATARPARERREELDRARRTLYAARFALLDGADAQVAQPYALAAAVCNILAHRAQLLTLREATELGERISEGTVTVHDLDELIGWLTEEIGDVPPEVSAELQFEDGPVPLRRTLSS